MKTVWLALLLATIVVGCSGSGNGTSEEGTAPAATGPCNGFCSTDNPQSLTVADVTQILAQGIAEADARGVDATMAVVDRVGNVLAVYRVNGMPLPVLISSDPNGTEQSNIFGGLEGIYLPALSQPFPLNVAVIDDQAAIAKALTGAYFSSEGNALSTRVASQVVQEHFNPGELFQPAGPLFGVQISQLACSDFNVKDFTRSEGPKKSPLGFAADPGGLPLYKNGVAVGAVGVISDGIYSLDKDISDLDKPIDEIIATAATFGFSAPVDIRGDNIAVEGKILLFSNVDFDDLASDPSTASTAAVLPANLVATTGYTDGTIKAGVAFGQLESGIAAATDPALAGPKFFTDPDLDAFIFVRDDDSDGNFENAFPPIAGAEPGGGLTQTETETILTEALKVANRARRQVGRPLNGPARVNITMVDSLGNIIGMVRSRDAIVDGADVTVQKARTAVFWSSGRAEAFLDGLPDATNIRANNTEGLVINSTDLGQYADDLLSFVGDPTVLDGSVAWSERGIGGLGFPYFADGKDGNPPGPLSRDPGQWSIFSLGLQLEVSINAILQHVLYTAGLSGVGFPDVGIGCAGVDLGNLDVGALVPPSTVADPNDPLIANGLQTFAGSIPIYKGNTLVGGIGVSGDGNDQADLVAFLGVHNAGQLLGTVNNAPLEMRSDRVVPGGVRLRYVQCPIAPFFDSDEQNVCQGK